MNPRMGRAFPEEKIKCDIKTIKIKERGLWTLRFGEDCFLFKAPF
jgi:hypothetical protein